MELPRIVIGTSALGNLYSEPSYEQKKKVVEQALICAKGHNEGVLFDSAGKYGAGLALEMLGSILRDLNINHSTTVKISNKLGWRRVPLQSNEPTFEPGVWVNIQHDAVLDISYDGMWRCFDEGNQLLGDGFTANLVSVHDPDEYINAASMKNDSLSAAVMEEELKKRRENVLQAYRALFEMKEQGLVAAVGVGCKDPEIIRFIAEHYTLDWAMFACSLTPYIHNDSTVQLMQQLHEEQNVFIINSAVLNGGFLIGEDYFDYNAVDATEMPELFAWREAFLCACADEGLSPVMVCIQFSFLVSAVQSVALNTNMPERVKENYQFVYAMNESNQQLKRFWKRLIDHGLIHLDCVASK